MDEGKDVLKLLTIILGISLIGYLFIQLSGVLTPFVLAFALAYLFNPLVDKLSSLAFKNRHLPRSVGVLFLFLLLIFLVFALFLWLIPILTHQLSLLVTQISGWLVLFEQEWMPILAKKFNIELSSFNVEAGKNLLSEHGKQISATMGSISSIIVQSGASIVGFVIKFGITLVVLFYLLRDWPKLIRKLKKALLDNAYGRIFYRMIGRCDEVLSVFLRGQLIVMTALGVVYAIGLSLVGLKYGILVGFISGLLSIVPYLGGAVGLASSLLLGYFQFHDWQSLLMILGVFGIGQMLESMVLTPNLVGDKLGLHPVVVIFAIMAGGELFGFFGVLLALPVAAMLVVLVKDFHQIRGSNEVGPTAI